MAQTFDEWKDLQMAKDEQHKLRTAMGIAHAEVEEFRQSEASAVARERDTHEKLTPVRAKLEEAEAERDMERLGHENLTRIVCEERGEHLQLQTERDALEAERDEAITARNNARDDRDKAETALDAAKAERSDPASAWEREDALRKEVVRLTKTITGLVKGQARDRGNMERLRSERDRLDKLLGGALEREALLRDKLHEDEVTGEAEDLRGKLADALKELKLLHDTRNDTTTVTDNVVALRQTVCELRSELDGAAKREAGLHNQLEQANADRDRARAEMSWVAETQLGRETPTDPDVPADLPNGDVWAVADCINYLLARERERT